MFAQYI